MNEKKKISFTIMSDQKKHKTLDLSSIAPVIIDVTNREAYVDMGALHARSKIEKGIKFTTDPADTPNGIPYLIVWVSTSTNEKGYYIHGAGACRMTIDSEARHGYKLLAEHVNSMDTAMKGRFRMEDMNTEEKTLLKTFIEEYKPGILENSEEFLRALEV